jgi:hypothetical protein
MTLRELLEDYLDQTAGEEDVEIPDGATLTILIEKDGEIIRSEEYKPVHLSEDQ